MMSIDYDPFDPRTRADPYPYYAELRERAPVWWAEGVGAWVVSRYEHVRFVLKSPELFSSDAMRTMLMPEHVNEPDAEVVARFAAGLPFPVEQLATSRNLITIDPPEHTQLRSLVNRGFTPRRIAAWAPRVREVVAECMATLADRTEFDLVEDLAVPVPVVVIAEMLGVERERHADFKRWSDGVIAGVTGSGHGLDPERSGFFDVMRELDVYIARVAEERRSHPRDDLISILVRAEEDGEAGLTAADVCQFVLLLLVAGNETTTNLIGNAVNALLDHPDQLALAQDEPGRIGNLVEEALRWDSPIQFVFRRATRDVEIAGTPIRRDEAVVPLIGSANRDGRQFPRAEEFDITRNTTGHLAFGFGQHFCLGASLARLEAGAALEAVIPELPRLERLEPGVEYIDSYLIRGPRRLGLSARPEAQSQ